MSSYYKSLYRQVRRLECNLPVTQTWSIHLQGLDPTDPILLRDSSLLCPHCLSKVKKSYYPIHLKQICQKNRPILHF